jgi:seryl-tRNA synthetase
VLDLKLIRSEPEVVRAALARRDMAGAVDEVLELDARRRELLPQVEELRAQRNRASELIAQSKRSGEDAKAAIEEMRALGAREKQLSSELDGIQERLDATMAGLPNLPAPDAPDQDTVLVTHGEPSSPVPEPRDHLELAGARIDMEAGARVSGSRFAYLLGDLVMLEFALVRWALELLRGHGFEPVVPPVLVREEALFGTGLLPDTEQQIYRLADDDLFLVGTSEVALASLHAGETIDDTRLPLRYAGFSSCFRREAGAAGRDTRGIFRVHQFDKVEMFSYVDPAQSAAEHERLLGIEEQILSELQIPYRVVNIAVGDLGNSAAKKYDCEAWLPSQGRYRELTSCSDTTDYQARRLNIRRRSADGRSGPLHTLNGTAVAVGRTIIALLENGQREDCSVGLPQCLTAFGAPPELAPPG